MTPKIYIGFHCAVRYKNETGCQKNRERTEDATRAYFSNRGKI